MCNRFLTPRRDYEGRGTSHPRHQTVGAICSALHSPRIEHTNRTTVMIMTTAVVAALIGVANSQGLFPPLLSDLEFGHPAWGTPTSRWSSTCPYGNIDGVSPGSPQSYTDWQALVGELDALKQRHEVMAGDTWQTIANQYYGGNNAAGLEQVLRYNGLDGSDPVSPVPGTFVNVGGTGLSTVLPECSCPVG